ncbi:MAG: PAS domain-containing protein [Isosphaeraceae bacterium]
MGEEEGGRFAQGGGSSSDAAPPAAPELVALCDRFGRPLHVNPAPGSATSALPGPERGRTWESLGVAPAVVRAVRDGCAAVAASGTPARQEVPLADGTGIPAREVECLFAPVPMPGERGVVGAITVVVRDVTESRRAEEALRQSERRYRLLAENATDMISRHAPDGTYLYASPASMTVAGYEPAELVGRSPYELIHPDDLEHVRLVHEAMLASPEPATVEFRGLKRDGSYAWLETTARVVREPDTGAVAEIQCATRDVTARRNAETEVRDSRALLQAVLDNSPAVVYLKDIEGRYLLINRRYETLFQVDRSTFVGRTDAEFFPPEQAETLRANDRLVAESRNPIEFQEVVSDAQGPKTYISAKFPLCRPDGTPYAVCGISTDITARVLAERSLQETSALLRSILDNMADAVVVADETARLVEVNPAALRMFGRRVSPHRQVDWDAIRGVYLPDGVTPFPTEELPLARALRGESVNDVEMFIRDDDRPEGGWVLINARPLTDASGRSHGGLVVCRDITERKAAEGQLLEQNRRLRELAELEKQAHDALKHAEVQLVQTEKLTALGQVVAGVAHEVNNPLAFVSNNVAVLQRDVSALREILTLYRQADPLLARHAPDLLTRVHEVADRYDLDYVLENLERLTDRSREGLRRIQQIVKDLRDFARADDDGLESADLNVGIASTVNIILGRAKRQGVEITTELSPLPAVVCHPGKINQVIMNLLSNAIDATPEGGHVRLRTRARKEEVEVEVSDDGSGIPPGVLARIFDPFFTTKPVGKGTGLGLSISYGIVKAHGGAIEVDSEVGRGSRFTVRLPLSPRAAALPKP